MTDVPAPLCGALDGHCITCSDEGIVMRVVGPGEETGVVQCVIADADPDGARHDVDVGLVDPLGPGDLLLVHAGVALARVGAEGAP
jgi:hydrogenase maturation factor